jgi:hypothetical protein
MRRVNPFAEIHQGIIAVFNIIKIESVEKAMGPIGNMRVRGNAKKTENVLSNLTFFPAPSQIFFSRISPAHPNAGRVAGNLPPSRTAAVTIRFTDS